MKLLSRLRAFVRKEQLDAEMSEEMRAHLELQAAENRRRGMPPEEARYAAQRSFGGAEQIKERVREQRGLWGENLRKDLRHGFRLVTQAPGFAATAIISLALGIGANTAMFSIVHGVMLRPLPYLESERLVTLWSESRARGAAQQSSSLGNVEAWRAAARTVSALAIYDPLSLIVTEGEPRRTSGALVSANLAAVLGVAPRIGRMLTAQEVEQRASVAVLSHAAWQQRHGGARDILGRQISIDGRPTEIIGVLPEGIGFPDKDTEFWLPESLGRNPQNQTPAFGTGTWRVLGRLASDATREAAQTEFSAIAVRLESVNPANAGLGIRVVPLLDQIVGRDLRTALVLLLAAVGAVLLIACSNVANLLLARGLTRQREFALRLSLGATRPRLVLQLVAENLVLCGLAAAAGLGLAWLALHAVRAFAPAGIPRLDEVGLDARMLPAWRATHGDPLAILRNGARGATESRGSRRGRSVLVVVQFALAVVLFAGAGMLLRSFARVLAVDPGFRAENVLVAGTRLPASRSPRDASPFAAAVVERVAALPGVSAAAIGEEVLLGERGQGVLSVERAGEVEVVRVALGSDAITADYFRAIGGALRSGRFFDSRDTADSAAVVIVNETLARQLWPNAPALGQRVRFGGAASTQPWATVVGVVADLRRQKLEQAPLPQAFWPLAQRPSRTLKLLVRTEREPTLLADAVRRAVREIDATVPVEAMTTLRQQIDGTLAPRRFHTGVLAGFAIVALGLAGVGIFGVMHYSVARRTQELGVRAALGAHAAQLLRQVLGEGLALAGTGVLIGLAGALMLSRALQSLLFEVSPTDPVSLGLAALVMLLLSLLACFLPARRAAKIDPMVALRAE